MQPTLADVITAAVEVAGENDSEELNEFMRLMEAHVKPLGLGVPPLEAYGPGLTCKWGGLTFKLDGMTVMVLLPDGKWKAIFTQVSPTLAQVLAPFGRVA